MQRGEIWLVSLDPTAGHEQQGTRPVVIVSPARFNELTGTPVVLPITTGGSFARRRGFAVSLDDAGIRITGQAAESDLGFIGVSVAGIRSELRCCRLSPNTD